MKQMKKLSALAAGSVAIGLLLGTSMAQAADVCYDGDIVTEIKNLDVFTESYDQITIDVDFVKATGFEVYGSNLENLPFQEAFAEEDAALTMIAINNAINAIPGVPDFVEFSGEKNYYIGAEEETENSAGGLAAIGGENLTGEQWDRCREESPINCIFGVAILAGADELIYADLSDADGGECGSVPPPDLPESQSITPGFSGSWYDEMRDGEGFNIEIIGDSLAPDFLTYFYTYDASGGQMWLHGFADINGDTAVVPMFVTSGAVFGDDFNPADVVDEAWGTITFKFTSCFAGTASYDSPDFGTGTFNLVKITGIAGVACP